MCSVFVGSALAAVLLDCGGVIPNPGSMTNMDEIDFRFSVPIQGWTTTMP